MNSVENNPKIIANHSSILTYQKILEPIKKEMFGKHNRISQLEPMREFIHIVKQRTQKEVN